MKERVLLYLDYLRTSFWAIPVSLMLLFSGLAFFNLWFDSRVIPTLNLNLENWIDLSSNTSIKSTLTATAAAILGVAGVSFSITIASLTLASQQFGPRLIRTFLQDRFTQVVLGFFVSTFLYCMLSVHLSNILTNDQYVPLSLLVTVLVLTVVDLILLVLFIHHISVSIQVTSVVNEVADDMQKRAATIFAAEDKNASREDTGMDEHEISRVLDNHSETISSANDGYIQLIDYEKLAEYCQENSLVLKIPLRAGDHVLIGQTIAFISGIVDSKKNTAAKINSSFVIGGNRNPQQDLEFAIRQLVEIGLRALSPGINDPFTAMTCIDRLAALLNFLMQRQLRSPVVYDADKQARLLIDVSSFDGIVCSAFSQLRQNASTNVDVLLHLLDTLNILITQAKKQDQAFPLLKQARWAVDGADSIVLIESDLDEIQERFDAVSSNYSRLFT